MLKLNRWHLLVGVGVAALLIAFPGGFLKKDALQISRQNSVIRDFIQKSPGFSANTTGISAGEIRALASKYPAVYSSLPEKNLYRVTYDKDGSGYECFVDMDTGQTLKCVRNLAIGLNVGG